MLLQLEKAGHRCTSIRGDLDHQLRDRVVNEFRTGITKILIATDVLSRGFDVTQVCAYPHPFRSICISAHLAELALSSNNSWRSASIEEVTVGVLTFSVP